MKKILIIEDDPKIARALKIRFESNGYQIAIASDAILGANLALQAQPDLIILDLGLPDGNGLALAEKFQGQPDTQHTPIIFVTASKAPNLRRRAMEMRFATRWARWCTCRPIIPPPRLNPRPTLRRRKGFSSSKMI